jgi:hypothetical protein
MTRARGRYTKMARVMALLANDRPCALWHNAGTELRGLSCRKLFQARLPLSRFG